MKETIKTELPEMPNLQVTTERDEEETETMFNSVVCDDNGVATDPMEQVYFALKQAVAGGNNRLNQTKTIESLVVDDSWVDTIQDSLYSLEKIAKRPTTFIKEERELVPIEKSRRADTVALRHLSRHSEFIKKVEDDGRITPSKILSRQMEEDLASYENRVVYTLILLLKKFTNQRYTHIKELMNKYETTNLFMESKFPFGKSKIEYTLNMKILQRKPSKDTAEGIIKKIEDIKTRIRILENSDFAKVLSHAKLVVPPLMRTNLLLGNTDYRKVYNLWLFIASFQSVGYSISVADKPLPFDNDYFDDLTDVVVNSVKAMITNNIIRKRQYKNIKIKNETIKKFRYARQVDIALIDGRKPGLLTDGDEINQYYYDRMKALVKSVSKKSSARDVIEFKDVNVNFRRFYKGVSKINHAMFYDMMNISGEQKKVVPPNSTVTQRKKAELRKQRDILKKYGMLVKMKEEELESLKAKQLTLKQKVHKQEVEVSARVYLENKRAGEKAAKELEKQKKEQAKIDKLKELGLWEDPNIAIDTPESNAETAELNLDEQDTSSTSEE